MLFGWEGNCRPGGHLWQPAARFMTVTCGLTAKRLGSGVSPTLSNQLLGYFAFLCLCHHWKMVPEAYCIWVCVSVSECISLHPENVVNTVSQKPVKGILPSRGHRCILVHRCADRFWGLKRHRSRSRQAMTRKPCQHPISKTSEGNFIQSWSQMQMDS